MYKKIMEFWVIERESNELQAPPFEFKEEVEEYFNGLTKAGGGIQAKLAEAEAARARRMLDAIREIRREKILIASVEGTLNEANLMEGEAPVAKAAPVEGAAGAGAGAGEAAAAAGGAGATKKILARLLRDVPSFIGADLKTYGPYKCEDVALLPAQNVDALIKRGIATEIQRR